MSHTPGLGRRREEPYAASVESAFFSHLPGTQGPILAGLIASLRLEVSSLGRVAPTQVTGSLAGLDTS